MLLQDRRQTDRLNEINQYRTKSEQKLVNLLEGRAHQTCRFAEAVRAAPFFASVRSLGAVRGFFEAVFRLCFSPLKV